MLAVRAAFPGQPGAFQRAAGDGEAAVGEPHEPLQT